MWHILIFKHAAPWNIWIARNTHLHLQHSFFLKKDSSSICLFPFLRNRPLGYLCIPISEKWVFLLLSENQVPLITSSTIIRKTGLPPAVMDDIEKLEAARMIGLKMTFLLDSKFCKVFCQVQLLLSVGSAVSQEQFIRHYFPV